MQHEPRQAIFREKPLEVAWLGLQIVWGGVLGNHQSEVNVVSQVEEDSDMVSGCICT